MCLQRHNRSSNAGRSRSGFRRQRRTLGFTLVELMMASTLLAMFAATIGALALGVQHSHQYASGTSLATQHARVVLNVSNARSGPPARTSNSRAASPLISSSAPGRSRIRSWSGAAT